MALLLVCIAALERGSAQRRFAQFGSLMDDFDAKRNLDETELIFARVQYNAYGSGWAHDYPAAEEHILDLANEATRINTHEQAYVIVQLDSEEIFLYPMLYFSEVGEMELTEREVVNLREYFNRGGFAIVDDFDNQELLDWFQEQMRLVFPQRSFEKLTIDNPIFHTFYEIPTLDVEPPAKGRRRRGEKPTFYGYFDESGRLCMIINHNNDIGDFWEWIGQPRYPLGPSTEALRFGINYLIYSMSH